MKKFLFLLVAFNFSSSALFCNELTVAVGDKNYPPYYYYENNEYAGFSIEVAKIVAEKLNYKLIFRRIPFARAIAELRNGNADMITNFFISPERENIVVFTTESHINEKLYFFTRVDENLIYSGYISDLNKYKIGVVSGYSNGSYIDSHPDEFTLQNVIGEPQQIKMLIKKRYQLAIGTKEVIIFHANKMKLADKIKFLEPPISNDLVYMGFSKKLPNAEKLAHDFSEVITDLKTTETYRNLLIKYGFDTIK